MDVAQDQVTAEAKRLVDELRDAMIAKAAENGFQPQSGAEPRAEAVRMIKEALPLVLGDERFSGMFL